MSDLRFKKSERLKSRKSIGALFERGRSFSCFPLLVKYNYVETTAAFRMLQVGFTVPSRVFRHAVDRNRIKRQMREAFRHQKNVFYERGQPVHLHAMFIYTAKKTVDYKVIEQASQELIRRLSNLKDLP